MMKLVILSDDIIQIKKNIPKKEKELDKLKKDLEKRPGVLNIPITRKKLET